MESPQVDSPSFLFYFLQLVKKWSKQHLNASQLYRISVRTGEIPITIISLLFSVGNDGNDEGINQRVENVTSSFLKFWSGGVLWKPDDSDSDRSTRSLNLLYQRVTQSECVNFGFPFFPNLLTQVVVVLGFLSPQGLQRGQFEVVDDVRDGLSEDIIGPHGSAEHLQNKNAIVY